MKSEIKPNRIYGLDILRAFAIIFVMLSHGHVYSDAMLDPKCYYWLLWDGVGLFFVLSGFLIGGILIKQVEENNFKPEDLFTFWLRRWMRTIPSYYLVLIFLMGCYLFSHHQFPPQIIEYFTFTQNFASAHPLFFGEAWSLSIEEWFYILIPLSLCIILRFKGKRQNRVLLLILTVLITGTLVRTMKIYNANQHEEFVEGLIKQVVTRIDSIMYGVLGAWFAFYKKEVWYRKKVTSFLIGILIMFLCKVLIPYSHFFLNYSYYSLTAIGTLFLLPLLSTIKSGKGVLFKVLTFISITSYSMYLTNHMIVLRGVLPIVNKILAFDLSHSKINNALMLLLFWGITIILSWLLHRFWEQPIMNLRNRFKYQS